MINERVKRDNERQGKTDGKKEEKNNSFAASGSHNQASGNKVSD
jgi:hypothetical protein